MVAVRRLLERLDPVEPRHERADCSLAFHPGQCGPEAVVDPVGQREVPRVAPVDVEAVGVGEARRVTIRGDLLPLGEGGGRTVVHVRGTPLTRADVRTDATVVVLDDVTADRASRAELQTFASSVAHDLRNPLTSVKGWALQLRSLTDDGPVDPVTATTMLDRVVDNADRMHDLIGDLLEHATTQGAELQTKLASVTRLTLEVADAVGVRSTTTVERTPLVLCDKALVTQLLTNLVQNAVKYVAPSVTPRVHLAAHTVGDEVRFTLTDNGTGIRESERERVFDRFYRGTTPHPGTGLGLSICRTIIERHGGTIHVEPGPGGLGSAFVFTLPAAVTRVTPEVRSAVIPA